MEGFCRGCLIQYEEPSELLQYSERSRRLFVYSTSLQVKRNDSLTFQLCKDCFTNMKMACKFKKLCRTSDKRLKNYFALKDVGESIDFCTFLKNNDHTSTFHMPLLSGNSTPATHKKDEDNESTCTSIRNFITDILQGAEVPDTEARIIREVIEEEADVLDDSLDSHWLHDDNLSIDTDFRLDFSFSPFSTPRSIYNDHCYTPMKLDDIDQVETLHQFTGKHEIKSLNDIGIANFETVSKTKYNIVEKNTCVPNNTEYDTNTIQVDLVARRELDLHTAVQEKKYLNFYTEEFQHPLPHKEIYEVGEYDQKQCTIDRNLEEALKNEENKEFLLDQLLVTPPVMPSGASTPTIRNIIFGDQIDTNSNTDLHTFPDNADLHTTPMEEFNHAKDDMSILDDFFDHDAVDGKTEQIDEEIVQNEDIEKLLDVMDDNLVRFDLDSGDCHKCNKKYQSARALKIHLNKCHNISMPVDRNIYVNKYKYSLRMCEICSEVMRTYTYYRHIKTHAKPKSEAIFRCAHCKVTCTSKARLAQHLQTHGFVPFNKEDGKKFVCTTCGAAFKAITNLKTHIARHTKNYSNTCAECGKGFYKVSDLNDHFRTHTGDRPFSCEYCHKMFSRRGVLVKHMKQHSDEKRYQCGNCEKRFLKRSSLTSHTKKSIYCGRIRKAKVRAESKKYIKSADVCNQSKAEVKII